MVKGIVLECIISSIIVVYCYGQPVADSQDVVTNEVQLGINPTEDKINIEKFYDLRNESLLKDTVLEHATKQANKLILNLSKTPNTGSTELVSTSDPTVENGGTAKKTLKLSAILEESTTRVSPKEASETKYVLQNSFVPTSGKMEKIIPPGSLWPNLIKKNQTEEPSDKPHSITTNKYKLETTIYEKLGEPLPPNNPLPTNLRITISPTKSPLGYKPQKPTYAGVISTGQLGQLIASGLPLPADPLNTNSVLRNHVQETTVKPSQLAEILTKSSLEYKPQKPTCAEVISSGQLGQLIPSGLPLPADPPIANPVLEDGFKETTVMVSEFLLNQKTTTNSPLQYKPQKPSYAGVISSGQLGQLIPPGKPWSTDNPLANLVLEDRFQESTLKPAQTLQAEETTTKSPLKYKPQKPSYAGVISSGQLGQLNPPGNPWPADPPIANPVLQDQFKETTVKPTQTLEAEEITTKSPLEYKPQKPSFAGVISTEQLGQLIPNGKPWPADNPIANLVLDDRFKESTLKPAQTLQAEETTTKSPLEYKPQKPSYAGVISSGQQGQLIPPGKPWPADSLIANPVLEDRFKETTVKPAQILEAEEITTKSPLEYKPQKPSYAGVISSGQLGQLIPPGKPWPADSPIANPVLEDRFKETTVKPAQILEAEEITTKSPLEYKPQKPSYAGVISSGQLGQLIPPGKHWPADNPIVNPILEDRFKETTFKPTQTLEAEEITTKSPLEYKPQKPSYAGVISSGQLGQLIPPGNPWPADPPIANPVLGEQFKKTTVRPAQILEAEESATKSPLEYKPQKTSYAGVISSGQLGQLIPPGKPWPADNPITNPVLEERFKETTVKPEQILEAEETTTKSPLEYKPQKPSYAGVISSGQLGQLIPPGKPWPADNPIANPVLEDRFKETTVMPVQILEAEETATKSPLEYKPQKPSYAGVISSGQLGQLIPPGKPWPANNPISNPVLEDRFKETTVKPVQILEAEETATKSPLEYKPQKPSYAGVISSGQLGQLIPPGKPWPADNPIANPVLEDRFKETTVMPVQILEAEETATKSPLEYKPQKPSYAGVISSGQLGQLIPPGKPWPADNPIANPVLEDRFKETTVKPVQILEAEETATKSPLEYKPQKPSYAGVISSGQLGQLIPPGKPWPADNPTTNPVLEDRFKETTVKPEQTLEAGEITTKFPLGYKPQKPSYAGVISSGQLGQLIPPGKPWPADNPITNPILEDRFKETTVKPTQSLEAQEITTKSPLEYKPQKPSYAGVISSGQLGQLIPPGNPWPADPPIGNLVLEDRLKETTAKPSLSVQLEETTIKSPLEYKPQKPSYAGVISIGQLGQLIPTSKPWPADNPIANPMLEDRFKETTVKPEQILEAEETTTKSPLEYKPQKPSYAGVISSGQLGQLIPPGNPWPADPPIGNLVLEDRLKETTAKPSLSVQLEETTIKSPLEYKPQKPSYAGVISSGQLGQLIPTSKPWPADNPIANPMLEDRFKETTVKPTQTLEAEEITIKSPLEYKPQKPSYAGVISSGQLGQLIPPGKPWPADNPIGNPILEDRFKETTVKPAQTLPIEEITSKSPLEYKPQKPTYAGVMSSGYLGPLIPPGKPWPADPPVTNPLLEDRFKETTTKPSQSVQLEETTIKSPLEYKPQKPTYAGIMSTGQLGQLIPSGLPLPAEPRVANPILEDQNKENNLKPPKPSQLEETTTKSPLLEETTIKLSLEYMRQKPTYAGTISSGQLEQLIPPGKPWPAEPHIKNPIQKNPSRQREHD